MKQSSSTDRKVEFELSSQPTDLAPARRAVEELALHAGFADKAVGEIGLCVNEALANVMRHAYRGACDCPIKMEAEIVGDDLIVRIRDWGSGVDPSTLPDKKRDPMKPGGLGLVCLKELMDEMTFTPQDKGMLLTLIRHRANDRSK